MVKIVVRIVSYPTWRNEHISSIVKSPKPARKVMVEPGLESTPPAQSQRFSLYWIKESLKDQYALPDQGWFLMTQLICGSSLTRPKFKNTVFFLILLASKVWHRQTWHLFHSPPHISYWAQEGSNLHGLGVRSVARWSGARHRYPVWVRRIYSSNS